MGLEAATIGYIITAVSVAASATGSVLSYQASQEQAKQSEMNAEAQAKALAIEQKRKAAELAENQRRLSLNQRRERAQQLSALSGTGLATTTGTPLSIVADTLQSQSMQMADMTLTGGLNQWQLGNQRQTLLAEGRSQAGAIRGAAGASLVGNLASTAGQAGNAYMNYA